MTSASSTGVAEKPPYKAMFAAAIVLGTLFAVWAVRKSDPKSRPETILHVGQTMATTYSVKVVTNDPHPSVRGGISAAIERELKFVNNAMSHYQQDSEISRFNRAPAKEPIGVSPALTAMILQSQEIHQRSDGAFDVTITPLVRLWGFEDKSGRAAAPGQAEIDRTLGGMGLDNVQVNSKRHTLTKNLESIEIDLSAIAKGYAVDRVALALEELGYQDYLVEIGGEVRTSGMSARQSPWRIAIERPDRQSREVYKVIEMHQMSMATSGDYRSFYRLGEALVSHTIDPRTGHPINHALASVTVVHPSCATADAWATALNVLGVEQGLEIAEQEQLAAFFISRKSDGTLANTASKEFRLLLGKQEEKQK